jgi:hypothetical protein
MGAPEPRGTTTLIFSQDFPLRQGEELAVNRQGQNIGLLPEIRHSPCSPLKFGQAMFIIKPVEDSSNELPKQ